MLNASTRLPRAAPIVVYATRGGPDARRMRIAVRLTVAIAMAFAAYIALVSPPVVMRER